MYWACPIHSPGLAVARVVIPWVSHSHSTFHSRVVPQEQLNLSRRFVVSVQRPSLGRAEAKSKDTVGNNAIRCPDSNLALSNSNQANRPACPSHSSCESRRYALRKQTAFWLLCGCFWLLVGSSFSVAFGLLGFSVLSACLLVALPVALWLLGCGSVACFCHCLLFAVFLLLAFL